MKKCKGCKCANCVYNSNVCLNTPKPCQDNCCDICNGYSMCVNWCSGHLTLKEVNKIMELMKKGLTFEEAHAIIRV